TSVQCTHSVTVQPCTTVCIVLSVVSYARTAFPSQHPTLTSPATPRHPSPEAGSRSGNQIAGSACVGVVLLRLPRPQHPNPSRQRRRHVHHVLARRDQLLGHEIAQPGRRFDRPPSLRKLLRPSQEELALPLRCPHAELPELRLVRCDRHRCVRTLVRVHPD